MPNSETRTDGPILELSEISKRFGPVVANEAVNFALNKGEVHALVGENGAGKTTLMRVLHGMYTPDGGTIRVDGADVAFRNQSDSIGHGIGMVHQHFMLVPSFTVAENITLGAEPALGGLYSPVKSALAIQDSMSRLGVSLNPESITGDLNVATQQKIEIIKVLYRGARIIILDEPTAVLTPQETDELFVLLRRLAAEGCSIIFISHKLREVFAVADRITVLRNGRTVSSFVTADSSAEEVVAAMTGRSDVNLGRIERDVAAATPIVLSVAGLSTGEHGHDAALNNVSFSIRAGEIVGIAGVEGNGQSVLSEALIGTIAATAGAVTLEGRELTGSSVSQRRDRGVSYVPEDRHLEGLPMNGSVLEGLAAGRLRANTGLAALADTFPRPVREWSEGLVAQYSIKTSGIDVRCSTLSGGNQQKIVLARELEDEPRLLILAQPTRGVDLGAIEFMYSRIAQAAAAGCAVLLISADLDEILRFSDRVLVMYNGAIVAEEITTETSREQLGMHMAGVSMAVTES